MELRAAVVLTKISKSTYRHQERRAHKMREAIAISAKSGFAPVRINISHLYRAKNKTKGVAGKIHKSLFWQLS